MAAPTFLGSTETSWSSGATATRSWSGSGTTPASGDRLYALVYTTYTTTGGVPTVTITGWSQIDQVSILVSAPFNQSWTVAFFRRTATGTSADDASVNVTGTLVGTRRVVMAAYTGAVGSESAAAVTSTDAVGGSTNWTPSSTTVTRGTSTAILLHASRSTPPSYATANSWVSDVSSSGHLFGSRATLAAGAVTMPVLNSGPGGGGAVVLALSGQPQTFGKYVGRVVH